MRLASKTDFLSGFLFLSFGLAALILGRPYTVGTASQMGPGYFPAVLGVVLTGLGLFISLRAIRRPGPEPRRFVLRPLVTLVASVAIFSLLIDHVGIAIAGVVLIVGCRLAAPGFQWREVTALALGLTAAAILIFGYALGIPFQIWPF